MSTNARSKNFITPEFRGSFVHLFDCENDPATGQPSNKHSITMLFPKQSANWTQDLPWLVENCSEALQIRFPGYQGMLPIFSDINSTAWPVVDGDRPNRKGNVQEAHKGHWCVTARSTLFDTSVNLVNGMTNELGMMTPAQCYSGCYFQAEVNIFYYDKGGNVGLGVGLNNVKFCRPGESLGGGGQDAAAAFGITPVAATAATAFPPQAIPGVGGMPPAAMTPPVGFTPPQTANPVGQAAVPSWLM